jgi:hypothetical protein
VSHYAWRRQAGPEIPEHGPWRYDLYEEGFGQYAEELVAGKHGGHLARNHEWLAWCSENQARLARMLLDDAERGVSVRRFFGSWYEIDGHAQAGYFLGQVMLHAWAASQSLREIACLLPSEIEPRVRQALREMAA